MMYVIQTPQLFKRRTIAVAQGWLAVPGCAPRNQVVPVRQNIMRTKFTLADLHVHLITPVTSDAAEAAEAAERQTGRAAALPSADPYAKAKPLRVEFCLWLATDGRLGAHWSDTREPSGRSIGPIQRETLRALMELN